MKFHLTAILLLFTIGFAMAQEIDRVEIKGKIHVPTEEKEGITIYNQNSKKGTTTDDEGVFKIAVAENDIVAFGALQFKDFIIVIDDRIIKSKQVSVQLVEDVNKLDEVIVLPYDLSGNLNVDAEAVRTYNVDMADIYKGQEDLEDYEFTVDASSRIENDPVLDENRLVNGINFAGLFNMLFKKKNKPKSDVEKFEDRISPITKRYDSNFFEYHFSIPVDLTEAFIDFVENKNYDKALLKSKNEVLLLEFLSQQSQLFLASRN